MTRLLRVLCFGQTGQVARAMGCAAASSLHVRLEQIGRDRADLATPGAAGRIVADLAPDVVVNAAAWTDVERAEADPEAAMRVNGAAVGEIAAAARSVGARLVHISTDYVFDGTKSLAYVERDAPNPQNAYGRSKLAGERAALDAMQDACVLRASWIYGPTGRNFVRTILGLATRERAIRVVDDQCGGPVHADEVARFCLALAVSGGPGGLFHLASRGPVSRFRFAREILEVSRALGGPFCEVEPCAGDGPEGGLARRPRNSALDPSRLEAATGLAVASRRDALTRCLETIRAGGWDLDVRVSG